MAVVDQHPSIHYATKLVMILIIGRSRVSSHNNLVPQRKNYTRATLASSIKPSLPSEKNRATVSTEQWGYFFHAKFNRSNESIHGHVAIVDLEMIDNLQTELDETGLQLGTA
ncbi:hypothetical protein F0562_002679 [Nyssa sinensis]|uniref:Uncharacterized protein n=1 Tax=Nyssa sinensis TaxID=561372 RepID=A0A5J5BY68_9ASTE|nr:hypothetical protein F0562_002679 [Nyssa sinensis]